MKSIAMTRYSVGKIDTLSIYQSLITTGLLLVIALSAIAILQLAYGFTGANITDGEPRIALIEQEDHSFILYQTVNGTTVRTGGYDTLQDFIDTWAIPVTEPEEELEEIEEEESESDNGGGSQEQDNEDEQEQSPPPPLQQEEEGIEESETEEGEETNTTTMRIPDVTCMGPDINDPCRAIPLLST